MGNSHLYIIVVDNKNLTLKALNRINKLKFEKIIRKCFLNFVASYWFQIIQS